MDAALDTQALPLSTVRRTHAVLPCLSSRHALYCAALLLVGIHHCVLPYSDYTILLRAARSINSATDSCAASAKSTRLCVLSRHRIG